MSTTSTLDVNAVALVLMGVEPGGLYEGDQIPEGMQVYRTGSHQFYVMQRGSKDILMRTESAIDAARRVLEGPRAMKQAKGA